MRWEGQRESENVEDRRAGGPARMPGGVRIGGGRGIGLGTIAIALVGGWLLGINPLTLLGVLSGGGFDAAPVQQAPAAGPTPTDAGGRFASVVLASTEDEWSRIFEAGRARYEPPTLVLYRGRTPTSCGLGDAAAGPFYCPADRKVYIDLAFFEVMRDRMRAGGDFAQAYVIAHEVGHHIQNLLGTMDKVAQARARLSPAQANALSVRVELQADCYAGVWAHHAQKARAWLEQGDLEEALAAAAAVGDDTLQKSARGTVVPETFTHGSAAQRMRWFRVGFDGGRLHDCDTFAARAP